MRGWFRGASRIAIAALLIAVACRDEQPPGYVRLGGTAPTISDAPSTTALLVVFWAAWCAPCREETPGLRALAKSPPAGLAIVVVSQDRDPKDVSAFLGGPPEPALNLRLDLERKATDAFGVRTLPVSFLLVDGRFVARFDGPRSWTDGATKKLLDRLIREKTRPASNPGSAKD